MGNLTEIGVTNVGAVGNYGYKYEGVGFRILANQVEGTKALLRYWKPESTDHFYTTNQNEINVTDVGAVGNHGYKLEGHLGFCFVDARDAETVPLIDTSTRSSRTIFTPPTSRSWVGAINLGITKESNVMCTLHS